MDEIDGVYLCSDYITIVTIVCAFGQLFDCRCKVPCSNIECTAELAAIAGLVEAAWLIHGTEGKADHAKGCVETFRSETFGDALKRQKYGETRK